MQHGSITIRSLAVFNNPKRIDNGRRLFCFVAAAELFFTTHFRNGLGHVRKYLHSVESFLKDPKDLGKEDKNDTK